MKRYALVVALLLVPLLACAQSNFDLYYDPHSVTTVTGTVVSPVFYNPANPAAGPQGVVISSGGASHMVFLGPGSYVNQLTSGLRLGDQISVTASRRSIEGQVYLVASSVAHGGQVFSLRTANGVPLWGCQPTAYQPPSGTGPGGIDMPFSTRLDNFGGIIVSSGQIQTSESSTPYAMVLVRASDTGAIWQVILGPDAYLESHGVNLGPGQFISVSGARVKINDQRTLVATTLGQGVDVVQLRMIDGSPVFPVVSSTGM